MTREEDRARKHLAGAADVANAPTIERGRRCQNCIHYETGDKAHKKYAEFRDRDLTSAAARTLAAEGHHGIAKRLAAKMGPVGKPKRAKRLGDDDTAMKFGMNVAYGDALITGGQMGTCNISAAPGDFVHQFYLCDKWAQKFRPDGAEKPDELPAEARARLMGDDE